MAELFYHMKVKNVIIDFLLVIQIIGSTKCIFNNAFWNQLYFVLLMKSHLESYPCPLINFPNLNLGNEDKGDMILNKRFQVFHGAARHKPGLTSRC
jgi:hypothetical protein